MVPTDGVFFQSMEENWPQTCPALALSWMARAALVLTRVTGMRRSEQRWSVSDTAEYGDYVSGPRVIDPRVKENMKAVLADIQSGAFADRFISDQDAGAPEFKALRAKGEAHPIEATGRELRKLFSWIKQDDDYQEGSAAR